MGDIKYKIQKSILENSYKAGACHIGSALSCVDILIELFYVQGIKPEQFYFGKASGVATYYAILADLGYLPENFSKYLKENPLPSTDVPGVIHSFGSVGHALGVAAGHAFVDKSKKIYVLLSDGDLMEGSTYEAALFIGQHNLYNLYVHVDDNKLVALGAASEILNLDNAYEFYKKNIPNFIRHETTKGAGISFLENRVESHYINLTKSTLKQALSEL